MEYASEATLSISLRQGMSRRERASPLPGRHAVSHAVVDLEKFGEGFSSISFRPLGLDTDAGPTPLPRVGLGDSGMSPGMASLSISAGGEKSFGSRRALLLQQHEERREGVLQAAAEKQSRAMERKAAMAAAPAAMRQREWLKTVALALLQGRFSAAAKQRQHRVGLRGLHLPRMQMMARRWLRRVRQRLGAARLPRPTITQLRQDALLAALDEGALQLLVRAMRLQYCYPNEAFIFSSIESDECYVLAAGAVDVMCGGAAVARFSEAGAVLGAVGMLSGMPRTATVTSRCETWMWVAHRDFDVPSEAARLAEQAFHQQRQRNLAHLHGQMLNAPFLKSFELLRDVTEPTLAFLLSVASPRTLRASAMLQQGATAGCSSAAARSAATQQGFLLLRGTVRISYSPSVRHAAHPAIRQGRCSADGAVPSMRELVERFVQFPADGREDLGEASSASGARGGLVASRLQHLDKNPDRVFHDGDVVATVAGPALLNVYAMTLNEALPFAVAAASDCDAVAFPRSCLTAMDDLIDLDNIRRACSLLHLPFVRPLGGREFREAVFGDGDLRPVDHVTARCGGEDVSFGALVGVLQKLDAAVARYISQTPLVVQPLDSLVFRRCESVAQRSSKPADRDLRCDLLMDVAFIVLRGEVDITAVNAGRFGGVAPGGAGGCPAAPFLWPDVSQVLCGIDTLSVVAKTVLNVVVVKRCDLLMWLSAMLSKSEMDALASVLVQRCTSLYRGTVEAGVDERCWPGAGNHMRRKDSSDSDGSCCDDSYDGPLTVPGMRVGGVRECAEESSGGFDFMCEQSLSYLSSGPSDEWIYSGADIPLPPRSRSPQVPFNASISSNPRSHAFREFELDLQTLSGDGAPGSVTREAFLSQRSPAKVMIPQILSERQPVEQLTSPRAPLQTPQKLGAISPVLGGRSRKHVMSPFGSSTRSNHSSNLSSRCVALRSMSPVAPEQPCPPRPPQRARLQNAARLADGKHGVIRTLSNEGNATSTRGNTTGTLLPLARSASSPTRLKISPPRESPTKVISSRLREAPLIDRGDNNPSTLEMLFGNQAQQWVHHL